MRAVLIVNPTATSTTSAGRDLLTHALQSRLELTVEHTRHGGHGGEIAQAAVQDGVDLVVVHGGDGTVSNAVNGILGRPGQLPTGHVPALAIVPGGSANVTARSLGIPPGPVDATNQLIWLLDKYGPEKNWRRIGLIDCGERWAVLNAGMGVDAEAVAKVEKQREKGRKVTPTRYILAATRATLGYSRKEPRLTVELPGRDPVSGVYFVFVSNSSPWTFAQRPPDVHQPRYQLRLRPGSVRRDPAEGHPEFETGCADVLQATENPGRSGAPRRRCGLRARDLRRSADGLPVRR